MSNVELAVQFFLQIAVILITCRLVGVVARRFGQPQVVAEMMAGVILGPSVFGSLWPDLQAALFPWSADQSGRDTQAYLFPAAQLGLALYMFVVGLEFRVDVVRREIRTAIAVSAAGMIAPFVLGGILAWFLHRSTDLFGPTTKSWEAIIFLGSSMCITAFPMLARIIHFKGLTGTTMGTVALGAGALDDVSAWCLLAVVLASLDDNVMMAAANIGGGIAYVAFAFVILRPVLGRLQRLFIRAGLLSDHGFALGLTLMALGAWFTDLIGLHAVFGAFVMGAAIPRGEFSKGMIERIEPLAVALLLPLFFAYSGLNTKIGLLDTWTLWGIAGLILLAAILGKGVACWLAAQWCGLSRRDSLGIGVLMNARGLMELIIINIGLARGLISPGLFAILVIMAIVSTLIASPVFDRVVRVERPPA